MRRAAFVLITLGLLIGAHIWWNDINYSAAPLLSSTSVLEVSGSGAVAPRPIELVSQVAGMVNAVTIQGNYAYAGVGSRLVIFDISEPAKPTEIGSALFLGEFVSKVAVADGHAYVMTRLGLHILEISSPNSPVKVSFIRPRGNGKDLTVRDNFLYLFLSSGLTILRVANPNEPIEVGFLEMLGDWGQGEIKIAGEYAYLADSRNGLQVLSIADPSAPRVVGGYQGAFSVYSVAIADHYAYISATEEDVSNIRILDISNPTAPIYIGSIAAWGTEIYAVDGYLYAPTGEGIRIIDVHAPTSPEIMGFHTTPYNAVDVAVRHQYAYVADERGGLRVLDVSNPHAPHEVAAYDGPSWSRDVTIAGNYAYVADGYRGVFGLDVTNPNKPTQASIHDTPGFAAEVIISGTIAYVADEHGGLRILDASVPAHLMEIGATDASWSAYDITLMGQLLFVAADWSGLHILDVSDPTNPLEIGCYCMVESVSQVTVVNHNAYLSVLSGRGTVLRILDISDPTNPQAIGEPGAYSNIRAVKKNYAFAVDFGDLIILDLSDPVHPMQVGLLDTTGHIVDAVVQNDYLYTTEERGWDGSQYVGGGLRIFSAVEPTAPVEVAHEPLISNISQVSISDGYAFIASYLNGLQIARVDPNLRLLHLPLLMR